MLLDPDYAYSQLIDRVSPRQGVIHTLESHAFDDTPDGRRSAAIRGWSVSKIKRAGGDAVKLLIWYRPDADSAVCQNQQDLARWVGEACRRYDLPFVLEMLLYPLASRRGSAGDRRGGAGPRERADLRRA